MQDSPEDHLNIWELLMKKRLGESPEDYKNLYDELNMKSRREEENPSDYKDAFNEMKEKLNNKDSEPSIVFRKPVDNSSANPNALVSITPDSITINAMKVSYSRENLEKVLDFINDISEGATKL